MDGQGQSTSSFFYELTIPGLWGKPAGIGIGGSYSSLLSYTSDNVVTTNTSGFGDPVITFDHGIYGTKSMTQEELMHTPARGYGGIHFVLTLPLGSYDPRSAANGVAQIGSNRYQLQITYSQNFTWHKGNMQLDFYPSIHWFGDNNQYVGGATLSQHPVYALQTHFSQNFGPRVWGEVGVISTFGGSAYVNSMKVINSYNNWNGVIGIGTQTWKGGNLFVIYNNTFHRPAVTPTSRTLEIQLMQIIGWK